MKYRLGDATKEAARALVEAWDAGHIEQSFKVVLTPNAARSHIYQDGVTLPPTVNPSRVALLELDHVNLIRVRETIKSDISLDVIMWLDLKEAVKNDFNVVVQA